MGEVVDFAIFLLPLLVIAWITVRAASKADHLSPTGDKDVVGRRLAAHVLDWVLIGLTWICVLPTAYHLGRWFGWTGETRLVFDNAVGSWGFVGTTIANFVILQAVTGYTWGKHVFAIRTVDEQGRRPGLRRTLLRSLPLLIEQFGIVALWAMARSEDHQRFGDRWAHTYVVYAGRPTISVP